MTATIGHSVGADCAVSPVLVAENARSALSVTLPQRRRMQFGQFMTPEPVARRLVSGLSTSREVIDLLDAGAGVGTLSAAAVEHLVRCRQPPKQINITAFEIDPTLSLAVGSTLRAAQRWAHDFGVEVTFEIRPEDFLIAVAEGRVLSRYSSAVLNPPYRKLRRDSELYSVLSCAGLESPNLYTAFWGAVVRLLVPGGEVAAITPRSFCNGTYFRTFRERLLRECAINSLTVYAARDEAFIDDEVLQETVITTLVKGRRQKDVVVTVAAGHEATVTKTVPFGEVVHADDSQAFIRLPVGDGAETLRRTLSALPCSLTELGLKVSTGRVVDFRARAFLRRDPQSGTVPLIYASHLRGGVTTWPLPNFKKFNAIAKTNASATLLVPDGPYVFVRRFSAKEERRRVVAALYEGTRGYPSVGIDNKVNYIHAGGSPLDPRVARGLCLFLNSTLVDEYFRQFNGHTQVNAGDLMSLKYPSESGLVELADAWRPGASQAQVDQAVHHLFQ